MIIYPTSSELADIAHALGMDARTAKAHRKLLNDVWKAAIYSAVRAAYPAAIRAEVARLRPAKLRAAPAPFVPVSLADLLPHQPDDPGVEA